MKRAPGKEQEKKASQRPEHHDYCPHASSFSLLTRILFSSKHTRSPEKIQAVQRVELFRLSALYPRDEQGIPGANCLLSLADSREPVCCSERAPAAVSRPIRTGLPVPQGVCALPEPDTAISLFCVCALL